MNFNKDTEHSSKKIKNLDSQKVKKRNRFETASKRKGF
jgi:hypothetical protein